MTSFSTSLNLCIGTICSENSFFLTSSYSCGRTRPQSELQRNEQRDEQRDDVVQNTGEGNGAAHYKNNAPVLENDATETGARSLSAWLNQGVLSSKVEVSGFSLAVYTVRVEGEGKNIQGFDDPFGTAAKSSLLTYEFIFERRGEADAPEAEIISPFRVVLENLRLEERRRAIGQCSSEGLQRFIGMEIEYVESDDDGSDNEAENSEEGEELSPPNNISWITGSSTMEHTDLGSFVTEKYIVSVHINKRSTSNHAAAIQHFASISVPTADFMLTPNTKPSEIDVENKENVNYFSPMATSEVSTLVMQTQTPSTVDLTQGVFY
ncbi:hypothetical protein TrVE_jg9941 [Triparma verrucosa]|uniref:Uncharacterized protein n=1 Tax=Triparma verrucosa TaxID=1606542 RepID=A0A9W7EY71_9STRA|nr:hypothetical protein TrVE_jg9941 [Triparma verrucosa]